LSPDAARGKAKVRRRRKTGSSGGGKTVVVYWNPRGIHNKEEVFKAFLSRRGSAYDGLSESQTYKSSELTDATWRWDAGKESKPPATRGKPARGIGAFINTRKCTASVVTTGKYTLWHRIELAGLKEPLYCGVCYFPQATDVKQHAKANAELLVDLLHFKVLGHVVVGGDFNAHWR
jgi:hypothetical protein